VALHFSVRLNGITALALTKLDVLSGLAEIPVAVAYNLDGQILEDYPAQREGIERVVPVYESRPGWSEDISGARTWDQLPRAARDYVAFIEELAGVPVTIIGVGQAPEATILHG
ncbi:MAG TPA: adenylosuccinate synthetase, partial [Ardenticatenaceae bacterium]|nr:adenylosuccinate synthetase [Ardenticatenaceae bacterium]